ncbi:MAG: transcriptional repressor [Candidatus Cloacimonetes bacterium]|nr:transcriptional repressor [Candidatus Cloacimonadota bacterium]MBS3768149.1 transcriptional repressor [Candidatus Cloacimonadota bacterium]
MKNKLNRFRKFIKDSDLLFSRERHEIAACVFDLDTHFSADELYLKLKQQGSNVSRATVYRTLDLLVKAKLLSKLQMKQGQHLYENYDGIMHHDHMICVNCGKIIEFSSTEIETIQKQICKKYNFKMKSHMLRICGLCEECQKK